MALGHHCRTKIKEQRWLSILPKEFSTYKMSGGFWSWSVFCSLDVYQKWIRHFCFKWSFLILFFLWNFFLTLLVLTLLIQFVIYLHSVVLTLFCWKTSSNHLLTSLTKSTHFLNIIFFFLHLFFSFLANVSKIQNRESWAIFHCVDWTVVESMNLLWVRTIYRFIWWYSGIKYHGTTCSVLRELSRL